MRFFIGRGVRGQITGTVRGMRGRGVTRGALRGALRGVQSSRGAARGGFNANRLVLYFLGARSVYINHMF